MPNIISQRGYSSEVLKSVDVRKEQLELGKEIYEFAQNLDKKVVIAISGDLSHKHPTDCKLALYLPDPRWSRLSNPCAEAAGKLDELIDAWANSAVIGADTCKDLTEPVLPSKQQKLECYTEGNWNSIVSRNWLDNAYEWQSQGLSCGIGGFYVLHGLLENAEGHGHKVQSKLITRQAPTYYGMMVTTFELTKSD